MQGIKRPKCVRYWPEKVGSLAVYKRILVTLLEKVDHTKLAHMCITSRRLLAGICGPIPLFPYNLKCTGHIKEQLARHKCILNHTERVVNEAGWLCRRRWAHTSASGGCKSATSWRAATPTCLLTTITTQAGLLPSEEHIPWIASDQDFLCKYKVCFVCQ